MNEEPEFHLFCHRCGAELTPGDGNWYVVRIEAFADPSPPNFSESDLDGDLNAEFSRLIEQMKEMSRQELMDQVYRRLTVHLCAACYKEWIENPAG